MSVINSSSNIVDTSGAVLSSGAIGYFSTHASGPQGSIDYVQTGNPPVGPVPGVAINLVSGGANGSYPTSGVTYSVDMSVGSGVTFDGISGYLDIPTLPASASDPIGILFSYSLSSGSALDINLFDLTDGINYLVVKIPANTSTINTSYDTAMVTSASNPQYTNGTNTVFVYFDGVSSLKLYINGLLAASTTYTPVSWTPNKGTFGALWTGTSYAGFSSYTLNDPAIFDSALTTTQILQLMGQASTAAPLPGQVLSDATDVNAGYLDQELVAGVGISITPISNGSGNDSLVIAATGPAATLVEIPFKILKPNELPDGVISTFTFTNSYVMTHPIFFAGGSFLEDITPDYTWVSSTKTLTINGSVMPSSGMPIRAVIGLFSETY